MQIHTHAAAAGAMPRAPFAIAAPRKASDLWRAIGRGLLTAVAVAAVSCLAVGLSLN